MTSEEEIEERQRKRDDYLTAFYELTKDAPLRWSSHHDIAQAVGISDDEAMTIGALLAERRFVKFKTMAGAAGSVELTSYGVEQAERVIRQRAKSTESQRAAARPSIGALQDSAEEAREWVEGNSIVVEEAFKYFLRLGEWPDVATLQRNLDRRGILSIDVQPVVDAKPRVQGEARLVHTERLTLRLRHLMWIPDAQPLVQMSMAAVRRAVAAYLSDDDEPAIMSSDPNILDPTGCFVTLGDRLYDVLVHEHPAPFSGSNRQGDTWTIHVDTRFTRTFREVDTVEQFIARQDEIRSRFSPGPSLVDWTQSDVFTPDEVVTSVNMIPETSEVVVPTQPHLFLSWSRPLSKSVASALLPILKLRLRGAEVFFSPDSIEPGDDPSRRLFDEGILKADALVVVLTAEGASSAYVIWETAAAWARDSLVIPVFVDIDPTSVPGPLHTKVQGVHLTQRHDLDRALFRLAAEFGIEDVPALDDAEYESLLRAAQPKSAPGTVGLTR